MSNNQENKALVLEYFKELESVSPDNVGDVITKYTTDDYKWFGMHPFYEQDGAAAVAETFWKPFLQSWSSVQRRQDIFMGGISEIDGDQWVMSMGHFMGLFDRDWLGIPATRKICLLRYAEFHCIENGLISKTALFVDILHVMRQAGVFPLPFQTGASIVVPGPRTHDGLLFDEQDPAETKKTLELVNMMLKDLTGSERFFNRNEELRRTWHEDMLWFGPEGIGSTYTVDRYIEQHQGPFRDHLHDVTFNGHISRFSEGKYACWFGWPNLSMTSVGGFLGMPGNDNRLNMRVVDVYRRDGDKLAENWIFIDLLYWLYQQGLDVLERTRKIKNHE